MKTVIVCLALCIGIVSAQDFGTPVVISQGPARVDFQLVYGYSGTNLIYQCYSPSTVTSGTRFGTIVSISAASNANPVSFTSAAHGFNANTLPLITISGGTGNWTAVNGTFTATITGANTFTIPVDSSAFGALTGTITFRTTAPRTNQPEWAVKMLYYDGSNNLITSAWLAGSAGLSAKCSDATVTGKNVQ